MGGILSYLQDIHGGILSSSTKKSGGDFVLHSASTEVFCPLHYSMCFRFYSPYMTLRTDIQRFRVNSFLREMYHFHICMDDLTKQVVSELVCSFAWRQIIPSTFHSLNEYLSSSVKWGFNVFCRKKGSKNTGGGKIKKSPGGFRSLFSRTRSGSIRQKGSKPSIHGTPTNS